MNDTANSYAILRFEKLKNYGEISAVENHNSRLVQVQNADPEKRSSNIDFRENLPGKLIDRIKSRLKSAEINPRKDSILAFEILMTFSPEMTEKIDIRSWAITSLNWATGQFGNDNIVHAVLHRDEKTPHLHLCVVPIVHHSGVRALRRKLRLNYKQILGGKTRSDMRNKLRDLQTSYALAMKDYGLVRGIEHSLRDRLTAPNLRAETIRRREEASQEIQPIFAEIESLSNEIYKVHASKVNERSIVDTLPVWVAKLAYIKETISARIVALIELAETVWEAKILRRERRLLSQRLSELEEVLSTQKQRVKILQSSLEEKEAEASRINRIRSISVSQVIIELTGIQPQLNDATGVLRFTFPSKMQLSVDTTTNFFRNETRYIPAPGAHGSRAGGRNAIDAVLFLKKWGALEAIEWLSRRFSETEVGLTLQGIRTESGKQREIEADQDKEIILQNIKEKESVVARSTIRIPPKSPRAHKSLSKGNDIEMGP